jgi:hypothetical protein
MAGAAKAADRQAAASTIFLMAILPTEWLAECAAGPARLAAHRSSERHAARDRARLIRLEQFGDGRKAGEHLAAGGGRPPARRGAD